MRNFAPAPPLYVCIHIHIYIYIYIYIYVCVCAYVCECVCVVCVCVCVRSCLHARMHAYTYECDSWVGRWEAVRLLALAHLFARICFVTTFVCKVGRGIARFILCAGRWIRIGRDSL